ncbi:MAG: DUF6763 family protein [Gammaproteobacteria bacterium]
MATEADPIIDAWYHYPAKAQKFRVTALDEDNATIEIQYFDGAIDELDNETWYELDAERIEAPEDWTGPMDNIEQDDLDLADREMSREDREAPYMEVDEMKRAGPREADESFDTGEDDWAEGRPQEEPWQEGK